MLRFANSMDSICDGNVIILGLVVENQKVRRWFCDHGNYLGDHVTHKPIHFVTIWNEERAPQCVILLKTQQEYIIT